ncbi:MAG TPA: gluconate 2-dehydrogenase subunit 3 family protein [Myxococcota bacterium]|nr:gluconate 2-dehydrogenase subunit 3 family protein [Myxococcota bacterium]
MPIRVLLLAAVVALAFWGLRRLFGGYDVRAPRTTLAAREWALVSAASDAMLPPGGAIAPSAAEAGVPGYVDRYVGSVPPNMRLLMRMLFLLFEQATLFLAAPGPGGRRRFSDLSVDQRVAVLERWRTNRFHPLRLAFTSLRAILCMGYLADPEVLRILGLAPWDIDPPVAKADLLYPPIGRPRSEIRHHATTPPSDGTPLAIGGPIHPDYREARS